MTKIKYLVLLMCAVVFSVNAQESADSNDVEEVVVTGTQIKGARINEALPVTVITADDIDDRGVNSGDELLATLTEQGVNQFNDCLLYTSPSPRDGRISRMPSSA